MHDALPDFLESRRTDLRHSLGFESGKDFPTWQRKAQTAYRDAVPGWHETAAAELVAQEPRAGGGERRTYRLNFSHSDSSEAVLLLPETFGDEPIPTILVLHDHGSSFTCGWDKMISPVGTDRMVNADESTAWIERYYGGRHFGDFLCERGFAVLCADALGWGSRALPDGPEGQQRLAANAMHFGLNPAGLVAAEDAQTLRWLRSVREVDENFVAAAGFSFGGYRAWQLAALCEEVTATVSLGWMARRAGVMVPGTGFLLGQSAFYMMHPGLGGKLDFPDMAGVGAGRPMYMRVGDSDPIFPVDAVRGAFDDLRAIWAAAGAPEMLDTDVFSGPHDCPRAIQIEAVTFLRVCLNRVRADGGREQ